MFALVRACVFVCVCGGESLSVCVRRWGGGGGGAACVRLCVYARARVFMCARACVRASVYAYACVNIPHRQKSRVVNYTGLTSVNHHRKTDKYPLAK